MPSALPLLYRYSTSFRIVYFLHPDFPLWLLIAVLPTFVNTLIDVFSIVESLAVEGSLLSLAYSGCSSNILHGIMSLFIRSNCLQVATVSDEMRVTVEFKYLHNKELYLQKVTTTIFNTDKYIVYNQLEQL